MAKRSYLYVAAATVLVVWCAIPRSRVSAAGEQVDIIVNKANPVNDLSMADAKKIFIGDKGSWPNGKRITVLMLAPGQPERAVLLREIYKMGETDYSKYFLQAAFTGKVEAPPKDVGSASEVKQAVAGNIGAIGYVKPGDADDSVKVVLKIP